MPQGGFADVPITVTRLNGSAGAFTLAASGLPQGVTAQFVNSTLRLRAAADAPRTPLDVARDITVTATPEQRRRRADAAQHQGAGARLLRLRAGRERDGVLRALRRARNWRCASSATVPFNGTVTLTVKGLPAGVTATPEPAVIPPGGGRHVDVKIRLSADKPFVAAPFTVEAGGKVATFGVEPAAPTACCARPRAG